MAWFKSIEAKHGIETPEVGKRRLPRYAALEFGSPAPLLALMGVAIGTAFLVDGRSEGWIGIGLAAVIYGLYRFAEWRGDDDRHTLV